jgi:hypothetical protein
MILDQVFFGVLNEKAGTLEVFDEPQDEVSVATKTASLTLPGTPLWCPRDDEANG